MQQVSIEDDGTLRAAEAFARSVYGSREFLPGITYASLSGITADYVRGAAAASVGLQSALTYRVTTSRNHTPTLMACDFPVLSSAWLQWTITDFGVRYEQLIGVAGTAAAAIVANISEDRWRNITHRAMAMRVRLSEGRDENINIWANALYVLRGVAAADLVAASGNAEAEDAFSTIAEEWSAVMLDIRVPQVGLWLTPWLRIATERLTHAKK